MFMPLPSRFGRPAEMLPLPFRGDQDAWRLRLVPVAQDLDAGEYGLLNPRLAEEPELPKDGLLSAPYLRASAVPARPEPAAATPQPAFPSDAPAAANGGGTGGLMEAFGFGDSRIPELQTGSGPVLTDGSIVLQPEPPSAPDGSPRPAGDPRPSGVLGELHDALRFVSGVGPQRDDLVWDEYGNMLAPEVKVLVDEIRSATKADEPALRRRIIEMFPGEPRTSNWFHMYLSDLLAGDPPEEIHDALSYFADERLRDNRKFITFAAGGLAGLGSIKQPSPRQQAFRLYGEPARRREMVELERLRNWYLKNKIARTLERMKVPPPERSRLAGRHWDIQGDEFEQLALALQAARGQITGPGRTYIEPWQTRIYDHSVLDILGRVKNNVEVKSGRGRVPEHQLLFDQNVAPPVIYMREDEVFEEIRRMLAAEALELAGTRDAIRRGY